MFQWAAPKIFAAVPPLVWDVDLSEHLGVPADVSSTIDVDTVTLHADGIEVATQTVVDEYDANFWGANNTSALGRGAVYSSENGMMQFNFGMKAIVTIRQETPGFSSPLHDIVIDIANGRIEFVAENGHCLRVTRRNTAV
jgi:hypothetical protein